MVFEQNKANEDDFSINQDKLKRLKTRVFLIERDNYKTKKLKNNEIVDRIIKEIEQEVDNVN